MGLSNFLMVVWLSIDGCKRGELISRCQMPQIAVFAEASLACDTADEKQGTIWRVSESLPGKLNVARRKCKLKKAWVLDGE